MCVSPNRLNITFNLIDCGKFLCQRGPFAQCMNGALPAKKKEDQYCTDIFQQGLYTDNHLPKERSKLSLKAQCVTSKGIYWHEME